MSDPIVSPQAHDGMTPAARRLSWALPKLTAAEARWRPLPGGAGLELVDRQGRSSGWALVPLAVADLPHFAHGGPGAGK